MTAETVLNVFIDANILLLVACVAWTTVMAIFQFFGLKSTFRTQLFLLNGSIGAIILCPIFIYFFSGWASQNSLNISDLLLANYLSGNFDMDAENLQATLSFREELVREIVSLNSIFAKALVGSFMVISLFLISRLAYQGYKLRVQLQDSYLLKRIGDVHVLVSDEATIPYSTRGLIRRYIVIPEKMLTRPLDLKIAIAHELQHFRQGDVEWEFFQEALKPLFFWNPVYYIWCAQVRRLREYACDQVIINRSPYGVRAYCECLLRASHPPLKSNSNNTRLPSVALVEESGPGNSKRSLLRKRILMMTSKHEIKDSKLISALISVSIVGTVLMTSVLIQNPKDWSHDRLMLSTIINLERMNK